MVVAVAAVADDHTPPAHTLVRDHSGPFRTEPGHLLLGKSPAARDGGRPPPCSPAATSDLQHPRRPGQDPKADQPAKPGGVRPWIHGRPTGGSSAIPGTARGDRRPDR